MTNLITATIEYVNATEFCEAETVIAETRAALDAKVVEYLNENYYGNWDDVDPIADVTEASDLFTITYS